MALDAVVLSAICREIEKTCLGLRIDKIHQPEKDEVVLHFRGVKEAKLLLSASSNCPRMHFSETDKENPASPPMFCMILRKHLASAKLVKVVQPDFERIARLNFECRDELGQLSVKSLIVEIMGRHSNIILTDKNDKIIDAIKRIDLSMSSVRQVLPGIAYKMPPSQDKKSPLEFDDESIRAMLSSFKGPEKADKWLLDNIKGISPVVCREIVYLACRGLDVAMQEIDEERLSRLVFYIKKVLETIKTADFSPVTIYDKETGKPLDFSFINITQFGTAGIVKPFDSFSKMLDSFYFERDRQEHMKQRSQDILRILVNAEERISKKLSLQTEELAECARKDTFRIYADLLMANLHSIEKGQSMARLINFYEEGCPEVEIPLDVTLTPAQNAQKYYKEYRRAKNAEGYLTGQIEENKRELQYIDMVLESLAKAENERELDEIREELYEQGYALRMNRLQRKTPASKPMEFKSSDGFRILAGKNNKQNDELTLKIAKKTDIWLHAKAIPGSHVVICCEGAKPSNRCMTEAATIAAYYSKGKNSSKVAVDYTLQKNVKKPSKAKPGMVIYENFETAYVTPDPAVVERLKIKS